MPLAQTLNFLPPQVHRNFLPPSLVKREPKAEQGNVEVVKTTSSGSSYCLSGSLTDGSVNIWSTKLGLRLAGGYNFTKQAHLEPTDDPEKEKLYMNKYEKVGEDDKSGCLFVRNKKFLAPKHQKTAPAAPAEKKEEEEAPVEIEEIGVWTEEDGPEATEDNLFGLFDETLAA